MVKLTVDKLIEERKMSVQELADKAGITYHTALSLKRNSVASVSLQTVDRLCKALECQPGDLFAFTLE